MAPTSAATFLASCPIGVFHMRQVMPNFRFCGMHLKPSFGPLGDGRVRMTDGRHRQLQCVWKRQTQKP